MKLLKFSSLMFLLIYSASCIEEDEEKIFVGTFRAITQEEIDDFAQQGYTGIDGSLFIGDNEFYTTNQSITDISALNTITFLTGNLIVYGNENLQNLDGLENLRRLNSVGIFQNEGLNDISGIDNISEVLGDFSISYNQTIPEISGLNNISTINQDTYSSLFITNNASLTSITGFNGLEEVAGSLNIRNNPKLTEVRGFSAITKTGTLMISQNDVLQDLEWLNNLVTVRPGSTEGFERLGITISSNPLLSNLDGLRSLKTLIGDLLIENNTSLSDYCGLYGLFTNEDCCWSNSDFEIRDNAFNPTTDEIAEADCSL